jgi:L-ascorbate metabolism protein UlaG (beta-lactamase superfamily)
MKARHWLALSALTAGVAWLLRNRPTPRTYRLSLEPDPSQPETRENSVLFIGTATTIIRFSGLTILTDPNSPMNFEDMPPIDFVLLSHLHEDHFDKLVEERFPRDTPILTTTSAALALRRRGFSHACPLRTWDQVEVSKGDAALRIIAMPGRHGPQLVSAMLSPVRGSMLEFRNLRDDRRYRIYVSGDTLAIRDLYRIPQRFPHVDLVLLHLRGTRELGILVTLNAEQGIEAMWIIQSELTKEPLEAFSRAVRQAGWEDRVRYLTHGEAYSFASNPARDDEPGSMPRRAPSSAPSSYAR